MIPSGTLVDELDADRPHAGNLVAVVHVLVAVGRRDYGLVGAAKMCGLSDAVATDRLWAERQGFWQNGPGDPWTVSGRAVSPGRGSRTCGGRLPRSGAPGMPPTT